MQSKTGRKSGFAEVPLQFHWSQIVSFPRPESAPLAPPCGSSTRPELRLLFSADCASLPSHRAPQLPQLIPSTQIALKPDLPNSAPTQEIHVPFASGPLTARASTLAEPETAALVCSAFPSTLCGCSISGICPWLGCQSQCVATGLAEIVIICP